MALNRGPAVGIFPEFLGSLDLDDNIRSFPLHGSVVDGIKVFTGLDIDDLPTQASVVAFTGVVIDNGNGGPELGLSLHRWSVPPECSGPIVDGLRFDESWVRGNTPKTWGSHSLLVSWPPRHGRVEVVEELHGQATAPCGSNKRVHLLPKQYPTALPFRGHDTVVPRERLAEWGDRNPRNFAGVVLRGPKEVPTLLCVGDAERVRNELATDQLDAHVEEATYTVAELEQAENELHQKYKNGDTDGLCLYRTQVILDGNFLLVQVAVADRHTAAGIAAVMSRPELAQVWGKMSIVE